jgi:hypothetical protein
MLNPKDAAEKAERYLKDFSPLLDFSEIGLEEIVPFGDNWRVVLSAFPPPLPDDSGSMARLLQPRRVYKIVEIGPQGEFVALRNPGGV